MIKPYITVFLKLIVIFSQQLELSSTASDSRVGYVTWKSGATQTFLRNYWTPTSEHWSLYLCCFNLHHNLLSNADSKTEMRMEAHSLQQYADNHKRGNGIQTWSQSLLASSTADEAFSHPPGYYEFQYTVCKV